MIFQKVTDKSIFKTTVALRYTEKQVASDFIILYSHCEKGHMALWKFQKAKFLNWVDLYPASGSSQARLHWQEM